MALIDTAMAGSNWLENKEQLVQSLRLALVEELGAANTYEKLACQVKRSGMQETDSSGNTFVVPEDKLTEAEANSLSERILEIADDEIRHSGKLLQLIEELSGDSKRLMDEGRLEA